MDLIVTSPNTAKWGDAEFRCAIGKNGIIAAEDKREGDGMTPAGSWVMREVFYRADRVAKPKTALPVRALDINDGWCDAPDDPNYNKMVPMPYKASAENLWREEDRLYDYIVILGYNDAPVKPGMGSAIFFHVAREDWSPTAGCVALDPHDLVKVLRGATKDSCVKVLMPES